MQESSTWTRLIFFRRHYIPELVLNDPMWQAISAVKNHRVSSSSRRHVFLFGMAAWRNSAHAFIAKALYPYASPILDMAAAVKGLF